MNALGECGIIACALDGRGGRVIPCRSNIDKEDEMRSVFLAAVAVMAFGGPATALAEQPLEANPSGNQGTQSNCIAAFSSKVIHNGPVVSEQNRQEVIKGLQATCAH